MEENKSYKWYVLALSSQKMVVTIMQYPLWTGIRFISIHTSQDSKIQSFIVYKSLLIVGKKILEIKYTL